MTPKGLRARFEPFAVYRANKFVENLVSIKFFFMSIQIPSERPPCLGLLCWSECNLFAGLGMVNQLHAATQLDRNAASAGEMRSTFLLIIIHFFPPRISQILKLKKSTKSGGICLIIKNLPSGRSLVSSSSLFLACFKRPVRHFQTLVFFGNLFTLHFHVLFRVEEHGSQALCRT